MRKKKTNTLLYQNTFTSAETLHTKVQQTRESVQCSHTIHPHSQAQYEVQYNTNNSLLTFLQTWKKKHSHFLYVSKCYHGNRIWEILKINPSGKSNSLLYTYTETPTRKGSQAGWSWQCTGKVSGDFLSLKHDRNGASCQRRSGVDKKHSNTF